ncbi:type II toxin-antitoxin system HipA family toxin [Novosphingobium sp. Gsoil 351]|uniref:type II toxin-antitoxin system HipA family toxin n=1 Tax=Novosphingobium sp. Gsoil 351 TaxID=2675225 RepID=UPI0012B4EFEE|nr:HipA domain-containing protein [Novosphingobium sp. Gsoil 351]QGN55659.1 type II toxin-antitoxin system HipA family toxin [Novosphingobium sp. Gsoil 351]
MPPNSNRISAIPDRTAIVTFKGAPAGELSELGSDTRFIYREGWEEPIACALPADQRDHYHRGGLIPFFEHLGPEGWLRGRQARAGGTAAQDDFGLLLNYGADCIGAVGIVPVDGTRLADPHRADALEEAATLPGRTLSGVQKKLLAHRTERGFAPCVHTEDPATHIAKFNREDLPTLVQNEHLSLELAREVLGPAEITRACPATLAGIEEIALLVERFDRAGEQKFRLEDFAQILGKPRGREFDGKYDSSYEEAAGAIARHSARPRIDLARYFRLVVFNLVLGNADAHLKNFSLLESADGGLRLSPAYDLINTLVYPTYERTAALEIDGARRAFDTLDRAQVERLGAAIGLPSQEVARSIDALAKALAAAKTLEVAGNVQPHDFRIRYRDIVRENAARFLV